MRLAVLIGAAAVCLSVIATQTAYACPAGTVFSAYKGNGICAYIGEWREEGCAVQNHGQLVSVRHDARAENKVIPRTFTVVPKL